MEASKIKDAVEAYYDAALEIPNKNEFQKGIVRGLRLTLNIISKGFEEVNPEDLQKNEDIFGYVKQAKKLKEEM